MRRYSASCTLSSPIPCSTIGGRPQAFLEKPDDALDAWKDWQKVSQGPSTYSARTDMKQGLLSSYGRASSLCMARPPRPSRRYPTCRASRWPTMRRLYRRRSPRCTSIRIHYIERHKGLSTR